MQDTGICVGRSCVQGKFQEAQQLHQKALEIRLEILGEMHLKVAESYNNIAALMQTQVVFVHMLEIQSRDGLCPAFSAVIARCGGAVCAPPIGRPERGHCAEPQVYSYPRDHPWRPPRAVRPVPEQHSLDSHGDGQ